MKSSPKVKNNNEKWITHFLENEKGAQLFLLELARRTGASRKTYSEINSLYRKLSKEKFELIYQAAKDNKAVVFSDGTKTKSLETMAHKVTNGVDVVGIGESMCVLYLLKSEEYYKIGCTTVLSSRLAMLQSGNPHEIEVVYSRDIGKKALKEEKALHSKYEDKHVRSKWFKLDEKDVEEIIQSIEEM